jgi:DnaJ-class molecular chaperone
LRLARQGVETPGGISGDLYVQVLFEHDPNFRREGRDLFAEATIPLTLALFGGEVRIPTLTGQALLKVPTATQPESQFRLRGEGVPRLRGTERGDLFVTLHVEIPSDLDARQRELLTQALGRPQGRSGASGAKGRGGLFGRRP